MSNKVVAIVGSYRKGGTIDQAVEAILEGARANGAITHTVQLRNCHIEFCTNCRHCMQEPGETRGKCLQQDDLEPILAGIESADAVVLGAPGQRFQYNSSLPPIYGAPGGLRLLALGAKCSQSAQQTQTA